MTSNLGSGGRDRAKTVGFSDDSRGERAAEEAHMLSRLSEEFRGEFLNRVDEILVFRPLGHEDLKRIAQTLLDEIDNRAGALEISLSFDPSVLNLLVTDREIEEGGARPLRRRAIRLVEDPLSSAILEGRISRGDRVRVWVKEDTVSFEKIPQGHQQTIA
jgi:ATP-dependent Clp protease ATP-binding subunit ClpA